MKTIARSPTSAGSADEFIAGLYRAHAVELVRLGLLLLGDQHSAEDVVQDAFLGLQRGLVRLRDPAKALAYLRASVVNGCRSDHAKCLLSATSSTCLTSRSRRRSASAGQPSH